MTLVYLLTLTFSLPKLGLVNSCHRSTSKPYNMKSYVSMETCWQEEAADATQEDQVRRCASLVLWLLKKNRKCLQRLAGLSAAPSPLHHKTAGPAPMKEPEQEHAFAMC